jgi:Flp pilus assembly protein TadD
VNSGNFHEGEKILSLVVEQAQNKAEVYRLRGMAFEQLGKWNEALADYAKSVAEGGSAAPKGLILPFPPIP